MEDKGRQYKSQFLIYFDGCYGFDPHPNTSDTYAMGVCKLEYVEEDDRLMVHLRRPGLLIGKMGRTINALEEHLGIKVGIVEVNLNPPPKK